MKVRLESGQEAEAQTLDGNVLTLRSPLAFAPGSPIRFRVALDDEDRRSFEGRTLGSKRTHDGGFEVRLRFVNLRRGDRERLAAHLSSD
ncbi:MAG: PilZ domain-containing protein [Myxococcales bacterium]